MLTAGSTEGAAQISRSRPSGPPRTLRAPGSGITAAKGKLGMSLQTPRAPEKERVKVEDYLPDVKRVTLTWPRMFSFSMRSSRIRFSSSSSA